MNMEQSIRPGSNSADETAEAIVRAIHQTNGGGDPVSLAPADAADKLQQLGMLIGKVAHELRNPLGTINNSIHIVERRLQTDDPKVEQAFTRMTGAIGRCDRLIAELLDFAKVNQLAKDSISLDPWLTRILAELAQGLPQAIKLEYNLGVGEAMVSMDAHKMQAVISNLITNAAEALVGKNEIPTNYFRLDPRIRVKSQLTHRGVEICVYNNGPRIDEQDLEKILTPLYTTKSFGTGLGLSVVQDILKQHDGGLEIENGSETGVTFTAWISSELPKAEDNSNERIGSILCGLN